MAAVNQWELSVSHCSKHQIEVQREEFVILQQILSRRHISAYSKDSISHRYSARDPNLDTSRQEVQECQHGNCQHNTQPQNCAQVAGGDWQHRYIFSSTVQLSRSLDQSRSRNDATSIHLSACQFIDPFSSAGHEISTLPFLLILICEIGLLVCGSFD